MNMEQLRELVSAERERIQERHRFGVSSSEIVEEHTHLVDRVIHTIYHTARDQGMCPEERLFAITALGGYGRRELNPYSDVDIMILVDSKREGMPLLASFVSHLVAMLWDIGFEVGHSTRSVGDCVRLLNEDTITRTSLLEARYIVGAQDVFKRFERRMERALFKRGVSGFIQSKIQEWHERHDSYGASVYVQEPDIKQSTGGLRDVHTAFWIARARYGIKDIRELSGLRILSEEMTEQSREALDFLWRVRNELHYLKGRRQDQLTFELQTDVAHGLGYEDLNQSLAEEQLLHDYYRHAQCLYQTARLVVERAPKVSRFGSWFAERRRKPLAEDIYIQGGTLRLNVEQAPPASFIRIFDHQRETKLPLHADTRDAIRAFASELDPSVQSDPEAAEAFLDLLRGSDGVGDALRSMHQLGLLNAYLPEFAPLQYLVRRDYYHRYTVDEHTFLAIQNLDATTLAQVPHAQSIRDTLEPIERPELLRLALLFHDIGIPGGSPKDHDQRSTELARQILVRLSVLSAKDVEQVLFLVQHHLIMSRTAQQRDLDDPRVVQRFLAIFPDEEHLRMLYLLTFADMRAVNPEIWNEWNAVLLQDLYMRSLHWMAGGYGEVLRQRDELLEETRQLLVARDIPDHRIQRHFDTMPERVLLGIPAEEIASHICVIEELDHQPFLLRLKEQHADYSGLIVVTRDTQGLFHKISGVLASLDMSILSAQLHTREDGVVLNLLNITDTHNRCISAKAIPELEAKMRTALVNELELEELAQSPDISEMQRRGIESEIRFNNDDSEEYTIIDIHTQDRLGLLYTITGVFQKLGISIYLAKISTEAHSVADSFYVLDRRHRKILETEHQESARQALLAVLP